MFNIKVPCGPDATLNVSLTEEEALDQLLKSRGVVRLLKDVRAALERIADPSANRRRVDSEGMQAYFAINYMDDAIAEAEKYADRLPKKTV